MCGVVRLTTHRRIALIIPTYQAEKDIPFLFEGILQQTQQPDVILVIDSSSTDRTPALLATLPVRVHTIKQSEFDHGGTRKLGVLLVEADIYIFLTQDAVPADAHTFERLIHAFNQDEKIACVYGRQLPKHDATPLSAHARFYNYPAHSYIRSDEDRKHHGIKTCFNSNSFAAYKREPLKEIGYFPEHLMISEDMFVTAKLLQHGYKVSYASDSTVFHSHNFTLIQEFHRYFSIGVFHHRANWIVEHFDSPTREGLRFIQSEMRFLIQQKKWGWIPRAWLSTVIKYVGYQIGLHEQYVPYAIKKHLGINKAFWKKKGMVNLPVDCFVAQNAPRNDGLTRDSADLNQPALILLSTYNGEKYLAKQLDSLLTQTYPHWHLLIRDDGSNDQTVAIIQTYTQQDARITLLPEPRDNLKTQQSFSNLMEAALKRKEKFIFFCDQDDVWMSEKLEKSIAYLQALEVKHGEKTPLLVHSDLCVVNEQLEVIHPSFFAFEKIKLNLTNPLNTLLLNNMVTGCTLGMNRALLALATPIPPAAVMHDWWCALCAAALGKIECMPEPTLYYRQHASNAIGSQGLNRRLLSFLQLKQSLSTRRLHLKSSFDQARHLKDRLHEKHLHHDLVSAFASLGRKKTIHRYQAATQLKLKPTHWLRALSFWILLAFST
jgi:rhamnosyltransferase